MDGHQLSDESQPASSLATLLEETIQLIMAKGDDTSQHESEADSAQHNSRGARGRGRRARNGRRGRGRGSGRGQAVPPFAQQDQRQQDQMLVPNGHPGAPQPPPAPRFTQRNNQSAYQTAGNNIINFHRDGNPNDIPLGPRRLGGSTSDSQTTGIPRQPTTAPTLDTGPNYAALDSSRGAGTGRPDNTGDASLPLPQLENALSYSNSTNNIPPPSQRGPLRSRVHNATFQNAVPQPRRGLVGAAAGRVRTQNRTHEREPPPRLEAGDFVNFMMVKSSVADARTELEDGKVKFKDKGVYPLYPSDKVCEENGSPLGVYCEYRYGVVVAVFHGDSFPTATIIPEFTYSGVGAWTDGDETVPKPPAFCAEHIGIMNRSQVDERRAYETTVTNTRDREGPGSAKYSRGTTAAQPNPHPYAPWDCIATIDRNSSHKPKRNSLLKLSGSITVYEDDRITRVGKLENASKDFVRDIWLKFIAISTLGMDERQNFDFGKYSWLRGLDPNFQGPLQLWSPESDTTGAFTQDKDKDKISPEDGIPPTLTGLVGSTLVDPEGSSANEARGSTLVTLENSPTTELGGSRTEENLRASETRKRTAESMLAASPQELEGQNSAENDISNLEDNASGSQPANAEDSHEPAHKRQRTDTAVDDKSEDLGGGWTLLSMAILGRASKAMNLREIECRRAAC